MILYLDTSALVKKYFKEDGSPDVISLWKKSSAIVTSSIAYAEGMAAFYRKKREVKLKDKSFKKIINSFHKDYQSFICVQATNDLNSYIRRIVSTYPLRGFDAIHLASALIVQEILPQDFIFACFDQVLLKAAYSEGMQTFPENIG
jgi:predicted nucleic acid-binding protein